MSQLVVDSLGLPLGVAVTAANVHDTKGGLLALKRVRRALRGRPLKKLYADGGYFGQPFASYVHANFKASVEIAPNLTKSAKFVPASECWVVERSFAWVYDYRRLVIDYERRLRSSRAMIYLASINLMLHRLFDTS